MSKLSYSLKQKLIDIAGNCFWYWDNFYGFLESCGVKRNHYMRYSGNNKYTVMRNILTDLEEKRDDKTLKSIISELYKLKSIPDKNVPDPVKSKKLLSELRDICSEDIIEKEILERKAKEQSKTYLSEIELSLNRKKHLEELNKLFLKLFAADNPQQRGFELEKIIYELFLFFEFEIQKPYKTQNEQIDGYFKYEKFDYLLEIKWIKEKIKQEDLAIFDKKIDKKAKSTRGLFIAMNGFDENAILSISGKEPRIILADGEDLTLILNGRISLFDVIKAKVDTLVKSGDTFFKIKNLF